MNATVTVGFVPNPPGRGTLGLVWECLFTYFLCLWMAIHPDVFIQNEFAFGPRTGTKFRFAAVIFLVPEYALLTVFGELLSAKILRDRQNEIAGDQPGPESGGSAARVAMKSTEGLNDPDAEAQEMGQLATQSQAPEVGHKPSCPVSLRIVGNRKERWSLDHGFLSVMGALKFNFGDRLDDFYPTVLGIQNLAKCDMLPTATFLNQKLKALRKSDNFTKALVCLQFLWFVTQAIARRIEKLPITLLELNTLAQVWMTLILYGLCWCKPQGIVETITIDFSSCPECQNLIRAKGSLLDPFKHGISSMVPPSCAFPARSGQFIFCAITAFGVYLAIDALGWQAYFPTHAEMIMWRVSISFLVAGIASFAATVFFYYPIMVFDFAGGLLLMMSVHLGALARLVLTIESFTSLRSLPADAYSTPSWSDMLPHIG
jgi:hypothetical protein